LFMLVVVCRSKHSTWLKIKMAKIIKAKDQLLSLSPQSRQTLSVLHV
jgi:hypothetical protein